MSDSEDILSAMRGGIIYQATPLSSPELKLWAAVIKSTLKDLDYCKAGKEFLILDDERVEVMSFDGVEDWISSDSFRYICQIIGVRPKLARDHIFDYIQSRR